MIRRPNPCHCLTYRTTISGDSWDQLDQGGDPDRQGQDQEDLHRAPEGSVKAGSEQHWTAGRVRERDSVPLGNILQPRQDSPPRLPRLRQVQGRVWRM